MDRLVFILVVLAVATAAGLWWRSRNGRYTAIDPALLTSDDPTPPGSDLLGPAQLGSPLGSRATFVQLSSEVCAPCRRTHAVLGALAAEHEDLAHVDLDVAEHLDLVRRFNVLRTPTTLVLDAQGAVVGRLSGGTDRHHALAALSQLPASTSPASTTTATRSHS
ncbi:TlpA family protein disulfide reductase [Cellulomonas edaphi]|uniref:Thioredoxin family protein n=1 Tax=Cellulomonas edaphi TaxID=3053468 RepID=A0ABT7S4A5_9CELL|nr:thioredoxin family protein [Cellulomons edaphi]MDM7829774.1 thioredoxin family protein [Cellulomons edaphi]